MLEFPRLKQLHSNPHSWFTRKHGHFDFLGPSRQETYLLSYFTLLWPHLQDTSIVYPSSLVEEQAACMVEFWHLLHLQLREQKCPEITQRQWLCPLSSFVQDAFWPSLALFFPQEHTLLVVFELSPWKQKKQNKKKVKLVKGESLRGTQQLSPLKYVGNTFYAVQSFLFCALEMHSKRQYKIVIV